MSTQQLALSYDNKRIILKDAADGLDRSAKLETYEFPDGRLEVRWEGAALALRAVRQEQRVRTRRSSRTSAFQKFLPG